MTDPWTLVLVWIAGGALGLFFFGGLWWTVRVVLSAKKPALLAVGSLFLRMSVSLTGFYFVSGGGALGTVTRVPPGIHHGTPPYDAFDEIVRPDWAPPSPRSALCGLVPTKSSSFATVSSS